MYYFRCFTCNQSSTVLQKERSTSRNRSSHRRCSVRKGVLKRLANFTGKHLYWSLFLRDRQACNFIKERLRHMYFPVKFAKCLRAPILKNICERLLLLELETRILFF